MRIESASMSDNNTPPNKQRKFSVVHMKDQWYVACISTELKVGKVIKRTIMGQPLVLFRNATGEVGTLLDVCPHRNVPLSMGVVNEENLQCRYHGWEFSTTGQCQKVPCLLNGETKKGRTATRFATTEESGFVWTYMTPDVEPDKRPFQFPTVGSGYTHLRRCVEAEATLHATIENALDVPHTAYLHQGLFRSNKKTNEIEAIIRRFSDRVEAEYVGEPRPTGLLGRLLAPSGGVVTHFDRFFLPSIAQVEYHVGKENHIVVSAVGTPVQDFQTKLYALVSFNTRIPGWLLRPLVEPFALRIFQQDAVILKGQTETIQQMGGEKFSSTELDVLGSHIWRLMKDAAAGKIHSNQAPYEKRIKLRA